ncbi:MAG: hypothetical protein JWP84_1409 [Tardiphaga sp.]|nr:hypothetical protein [Tardiphaga sp.]
MSRPPKLRKLHCGNQNDPATATRIASGSTGCSTPSITPVWHTAAGADHIIAERGVKYGRVVMIPTGAKKSDGKKPHRHK